MLPAAQIEETKDVFSTKKEGERKRKLKEFKGKVKKGQAQMKTNTERKSGQQYDKECVSVPVVYCPRGAS